MPATCPLGRRLRQMTSVDDHLDQDAEPVHFQANGQYVPALQSPNSPCQAREIRGPMSAHQYVATKVGW